MMWEPKGPALITLQNAAAIGELEKSKEALEMLLSGSIASIAICLSLGQEGAAYLIPKLMGAVDDVLREAGKMAMRMLPPDEL